MSGKGI